MAWVFLLIICSTSRKSTLMCTTLWLEMAIFIVPSHCIDIESKQHSSKSKISEFSSTEKIWPLRRVYFVYVPICLVCLVCLFISSLSVFLPDCLFVCLPINLCVCLSTCLSCLSVILSCLSVCLNCLSAWAVVMPVCLVFLFALSAYMPILSFCLVVWPVSLLCLSRSLIHQIGRASCRERV